MRCLALCLVGLGLLAGTQGCYEGGYRRDRPWWGGRGGEDEPWRGDRDRDADTARADACQGRRGMVNERRWREVVDEFEAERFRRPKAFRDARARLLDDLRGVRDRACRWEVRAVDRLIERVRAARWRDAAF